MRRAGVMQLRWGWGLCWRMTQGSPALRANPGLNDGIPLGFREAQNVAKICTACLRTTETAAVQGGDINPNALNS